MWYPLPFFHKILNILVRVCQPWGLEASKRVWETSLGVWEASLRVWEVIQVWRPAKGSGASQRVLRARHMIWEVSHRVWEASQRVWSRDSGTISVI